MIEAVLAFALITAIGELIVLAHIPARARLKLLGSPFKRNFTHIVCGGLNLWIHWGTITGSMTAVTAFVVSTGVLAAARWYWGAIEAGVYKRGIIALSI